MPGNIYTIQDNIKPDVQQLGGKGTSLVKLAKQFPIPPFIIIQSAFFDGETKDSLPAKIQHLLPAIQAELPGEKLLAVRSSASIEDSVSHSFAGQFTTLLNVSFYDLPAAITKVWQSGFSDIVKTYKQNAGITTPHSMAVVVQEMIDATTSGVAFGINPLNGNKAEKVINAIHGLGENLVSGLQNADAYTVANETITERNLVDATPVLNDEQIMLLANQLIKLESFFGQPQDIEFAFSRNEFYLLQSRPVTTNITTDKTIVWDNSNIVESYPGLTLPLTFSFIEIGRAHV